MFRHPAFRFSLLLLSCMALPISVSAQQTLGAITGQVTDSSGAVVSGATVTAVGDQTALTRSTTTSGEGVYTLVNLPIGAYTISIVNQGYDTQKFPGITVQADRTATLNAVLKIGQISQSVTVEASPLLNTVDATNGYVLDKAQIDSVPLPTGSFTGLAILSPGVNAELPGGTGSNSGLGNAPIWANGQRDTSNAFLLNGVDASNLFNGKSTSQVESARVVNNTGGGASSGTTSAGVEPSASSVYLSIGNSLPTPAPETLQEVRVNASMYDAQQGSASGAHIDMSTGSGTNAMHGTLYAHRGTNWLNAAPFFFKNNTGIPLADRNPQLHRYIAGGTFAGPVIKDKLFYFLGYQHLHISDQETGDTLIAVPPGLSDTNRNAAGLAQIVDNSWGGTDGDNGFSVGASDWAANPVGLALMQAKLPNGQWLIPNDNGHIPDPLSPSNAFETGTSYFTADQAVADLDWNTSPTDLVSLKYYYQHDPNSSPYGTSSVPGFTEYMDAGSQVATITNIQTLRPTLSLTETLGILREKAYSTNGQLFTPEQVGMNPAFGNYFPGITIVDTLGSYGSNLGLPQQALNIGPSAANQGAFTGVFQNRIEPSANAIWTKGAHSITFGGNWWFSQLNVRDLRTGKGAISTPDFSTFAMNWVSPYSTDGFVATDFLQGDANRYYRANQVGLYLQDKWQIDPNLSITGGLRYDWNGGLTEKYGRIYNFDAAAYAYNAGADQITSSGIIVAGNNAAARAVNGTTGVSNTTLTGRQWGIAPRIGFAWQPSALRNKFVVRGGSGFYYDRGELYTYFSPGYAAGEIAGGPFGVSQTAPFVTAQSCPYTASPYGNTSFLYNYYIPICGLSAYSPEDGDLLPYNLANPWGPTRNSPPSNPSAASLVDYLPDAAGIIAGAQPFTLGIYNPKNKLPYSINYTLDLEWQPGNTIMIDLGYVGNLGRHQVIPLPFNQAQIATPSKPTHPGGAAQQDYTYGYTVYDPNTFFPICVNQDPNCTYGYMQQNYEGGNVDLRVPYLGFSSESESYTAAGISTYNALQAHLEKRLSRGFQTGVSYTYSHATDEQSALGLFYNGNNPNNLRSGYGSADFDRTHVLNFTYGFVLPKYFNERSLAGKIGDDWSLTGIAIIQSGQPYSIIDFSGAVGSLYFSTFDGITNPIVPLAPGCTAKSALTGHSGAFYNNATGGGAALKASCFTLPLVSPGTDGVPNGDNFETTFSSGQRNIFRQAFQKRADMSLIKTLQFSDRYGLRYTFDVYNVTNTTSFDIPTDEVTQNAGYNNAPYLASAYSQVAPTPQQCQSNSAPANTFYSCPTGLGVVKHTIGAPRQIQMSLHFNF